MSVSKLREYRNSTIDIAKGVGIILVVIGHLPTIYGGGNIYIPYGIFLHAFRMVF